MQGPDRPESGPAEIPLAQAERLTAVKFARYTALTADNLTGLILNLTTKLEEAGILDPKRQSRIERDNRIKKASLDVAKSDHEVAEMIRLIPGHPHAERLLQALLKGVVFPSAPVGDVTEVPMETVNIPSQNLGQGGMDMNSQLPEIQPVDQHDDIPLLEDLSSVSSHDVQSEFPTINL